MCGGCCDGGGFVSTSSAAHADLGARGRLPRASTRRLAFLIFHSAHPEVLTRMVRLAREMVAAERAKGSTRPKIVMRAVWEVARWGINCEPVRTGHTRPVLNNNLAPEYARWMSEMYPNLADVFFKRERAGEREEVA